MVTGCGAWTGVMLAAEGTATEALLAVAREYSPRVEPYGAREVALDLHGLSRLFGDARAIGEALRATAADRGLRVRLALAGTTTAARILVRHRAGLSIVQPGEEAAVLAPLPVRLLADLVSGPDAAASGGRGLERGTTAPGQRSSSDDLVAIFERWGLRTLGEVACLPPDEVAARLGADGVAWQRLARGADPRPLVPAVHEERFAQALDLEWPIDGLEPLAFVVGGLLERLSAQLVRRGRGAAVLHLRLSLVTRTVHARALQLPIAMHDARALRTVLMLDLEAHPPEAGIDRVEVEAEPTPGRVVQFSLLTRPLPSPEQISTLMARLSALMGDGRCGTPVPVDSWRPGAFALAPFAPADEDDRTVPAIETVPFVALRRFRHPVPVRVEIADGRPSRVTADRRGLPGGRVVDASGPWRTSGEWWQVGHPVPLAPKPAVPETSAPRLVREPAGWDHDEWDVTLSDGASCRLSRERASGRWFIEAVVD